MMEPGSSFGSILDVTISKEITFAPARNGITMAMFMHVSNDSGSDDEVPHVHWQSFNIFLPLHVLAKGKDKIIEEMEPTITNMRLQYFKTGVDLFVTRMHEAILAADFSPWAQLYIPEPASPTRH